MLQDRLRQWREFNRWQENEDPTRIISAEQGLKWAGEVAMLMRKLHGPPTDRALDYEGVRTMQERLSRIRPEDI